MSSWCHENLNIKDIKILLQFNKLINSDATDEEAKEFFSQWLERNKEFRDTIMRFNENQLNQFKTLLHSFTKVKDEKDVFFPFNVIKLYAKKIQDEENNKKSVLDELKEEMNLANQLKLSPFSFNEFMQRKEKKKYLVKNMFATGTINMIYSPPASMKSFISYYLAMCLVSGKSFFHQKVKKSNVGYFDWENPISDIQNRINGMCQGMKFNKDELENLYFFTRQPTFLRVDKFEVTVLDTLRVELLDFIKAYDLKVLFFDTFRRLGNFDENDSRVINAIKSELFDPIIKQTDCCIIFLHHTSKSGENYRGSVDIEGILDTSYSVTKKEKNQELTLKNTKRRNSEVEILNISYEIETESFEDEDGDMFEVIKSVDFSKVVPNEENDENDYSQARKVIIDTLEVNCKYRNKEIVDILIEKTNVSDRTAKRIINWLVNKEILLKIGSGHGSRYQLHPELKFNIIHEVSNEETTKIIEQYLHDLFIENDLINISDLKKSEYGKGKFDEKYLSIIIDKWVKKGWINPAKEGYLMVTDLYRGEQLENDNR